MSIYRIAYGMLLFLLVFIVIAVWAGMDFPGDSAVNEWFGNVHSDSLDSSMTFISNLGAFPYCLIASLLFGLIFWLMRRKNESLFIIAAPYIGVCISYILKLTIRRPRPLPDSAATSFPSGHTIFTFILMGLLIYFLPLIIKNQTGRILCQLAAILSIIAMCFSRLYLQAHWLSDIISSLIIGTLILIPAIMLYQKINKGKSNARTS